MSTLTEFVFLTGYMVAMGTAIAGLTWVLVRVSERVDRVRQHDVKQDAEQEAARLRHPSAQRRGPAREHIYDHQQDGL
jgi:uncharacterized membrane protein YciS (DUF1049 family)